MDTATDALIRAELADLGLTWVDRISWNAPAPVLYQEAVARGEGLVAEGGGLVVTTGQHTGRSPNDKFVVRDATTEDTIWWDNNKAMSRDALRDAAQGLHGPCPAEEPLCAGPGRRGRSRLPASHPRHHRIRLACAVHPAPADRAGGPQRLRAAAHHHRPALLQGRSRPPRHAQRDGDRARPRQRPRPHRRHAICGRDEEGGLHRAQLPAAREGRDAHALLRQCRPQGRQRGVLRPLRHRQDHALRRPVAHARSATTSMAGRRTASSISRAAAMPRSSSSRRRPSRRSTPPPRCGARCWRT